MKRGLSNPYSIRYKIIGCLALILAVTISLILYIHYRNMVTREVAHLEQMTNINTTSLLSSLEYSMLKRDVNASQKICEKIGSSPVIIRVWILNKKGEVKVASNRNDIGRKIDMNDPMCKTCHSKMLEIKPTNLVFEEGSKKYFRNVLPVYNKKECHECHNPSEALSGMILIDYSMQEHIELFRDLCNSFFYSVLFLIVATCSVIYLLMEFVIIRKINILKKGITQFGEGKFKTPIEIKGRDEIKELADTINNMAAQLDSLCSNMHGMVDERTRELSSLLKASHAIMEHRDFQSAARAVFDVAKDLIGASGGYVALLSENGTRNEALFLDSGGKPCTVDPNLPMPIRGLRETAYRAGKPVYENVFSKSEWIKFLPEGHALLDNVLFGPLMLEGKVVGLIGLANKPGGFDENDAKMVSALSDITTIGLLNSRAFDTLKQRIDELEEFRKVTIKRELRMEELRKRVEELEKELKRFKT